VANSIFDYQDEELDEAYRYARLAPSEQIALRQREAEKGVVAGAESVMRSGLGLGPSEDRNRGQAGLELRELAKKVAPGTVEFYTAAIDILRKYGLVGDAEKMAQQLRAVEIGKAGEHSPTLKLQRDKDTLLKRPDADTPNVRAAIATIDRQLALLGTRAEGSQPAPHELTKLYTDMKAARDAGDAEGEQMYKDAIANWLQQKKKAGEDKGNPALDYKKDRDAKKDAAAEAATVKALQGVVRSLNVDIQSAEALLAHPGLPKITGEFAGLTGRVGGALSRGAYPLLLNVHAQTFLRALQNLKDSSKTTASGLGQLTEREGDKIQNARVALDTQQPTEQFKTILRGYIGQLKSARNQGVSELQGVGADIPAELPPLLAGGSAASADAPAGGAAARAAAARPAAPTPVPAKKPKLTATRVE
jgi:hypothetical protein